MVIWLLLICFVLYFYTKNNVLFILVQNEVNVLLSYSSGDNFILYINNYALLEDIIYVFDFGWANVSHKKDHWFGFYGGAFLLDFLN